MVDRRHLDLGPFQGPEAALYHHEPFVATGGIFQADSVIIGFDHPFAVILGGFSDSSTVNPDFTALCHFQISLEAKGSKQVDSPLGCGLGLSVTVKFLFEVTDDLGAVLLLAFGLLGVVAEDIAPSVLTVTYNDFLGMQVVLDNIVPATLSEHLVLDFRDGCHTGGKKILAACPGQFLAVVL